jgi:hypothetical protein
MSNTAERYKKRLAEAINDLSPDTFKAREQLYADAIRMFTEAGATADQLSMLHKTILEIESEKVSLARRHVDILARRARTIAWLSVPAIGALFTAIQFRDINFAEVVAVLNPNTTFTFVLTLYYLVLGAGFVFDIETQKQIYLLDPNRGQLPRNSVIAIVFYLVTAAILFSASRNLMVFAVALTIWHFSGMYFWRVLSRQNEMRLAESEGSAKLCNDYYALERLDLVRIFYSGKWHAPRHAILSALVLLLAFFAIPNSLASTIVDSVVTKWLDLDFHIAKTHLITFIFLLYALVGEGWTWIQRFTIRISLYAIDKLERQYFLRRRQIGDRDDEALLPMF